MRARLRFDFDGCCDHRAGGGCQDVTRQLARVIAAATLVGSILPALSNGIMTSMIPLILRQVNIVRKPSANSTDAVVTKPSRRLQRPLSLFAEGWVLRSGRSGCYAAQCTAISPARANGETSLSRSPLQNRPGSYQLAGRWLGSRPMCW
jgi:hypothetical protein